MKPFNRYLKYIVFTVVGVAACAVAFIVYAQQSDLPAGWEEPAAPLPPGSVRLEDVGKPGTAAPAQAVPTEGAPAGVAPAVPAQTYPAAQISTIPPVTGPHARPSSVGVPSGAPSGASSDLPAGWEGPAAPLPPGSVRLEDVGTRAEPPASAAPAAPAPAEPEAPAKKEVKETEEFVGEEEETEDSFDKPSRWDAY